MKKTAYYGSRISDSISRTPEGFLICRDVPIARVGVQDYLGREIGQTERPDEIFKVYRPAEEVFSPAAVASFEGKPVTENHPDEDVTSENYAQYIRGVVRDVRKGAGQYEGCLVADLVVHDGALVRAIQDGKREISCGYNCLWVPTGDHTLEQREIRGNHVAVVDKGRAGHGVAIHDHAMKEVRPMAKGNILQRMWAAFAKDADPEEALEAAKLVNGEGQGVNLSIEPCRWCKGAGTAGVDRALAYVNDEDMVYFDITVPNTRAMTQPDLLQASYLTLYAAQMGPVKYNYYQPVGYFDGI